MVSGFERRFTYPEWGFSERPTRDQVHQKVEEVMKQSGKDEARDYTWAMDANGVIVRTKVARDGFKSIQFPKAGDVVSFQFQAAPRRGGRHTKAGRGPMFRTVHPTIWGTEKTKSFGLDPTDLVAMGFHTRIRAIHEKNVSVRGDLFAAGFGVTGLITDDARFAKALLEGIGSAGPACYGFGTLVMED